mmetsp:Transcript_13042/g.47628  ORF Transcript_13042/g.47628 Transcript_13042/m.47628 type:complete len:94 (+) Transcript_13042:151-432(+)
MSLAVLAKVLPEHRGSRHALQQAEATTPANHKSRGRAGIAMRARAARELLRGKLLRVRHEGPLWRSLSNLRSLCALRACLPNNGATRDQQHGL